MKNSIFIAACFATVTAIVSCESNSGKGKIQQQPAPVNNPNVLTADTNSSNPISTGQSSTVQLNPAHGAPGHRCELAEGAPLNSSPNSNTAAPQVITPPTTTQAPLKIEPSKSTLRLNPPHGAPGHNCAVDVGKPL